MINRTEDFGVRNNSQATETNNLSSSVWQEMRETPRPEVSLAQPTTLSLRDGATAAPNDLNVRTGVKPTPQNVLPELELYDPNAAVKDVPTANSAEKAYDSQQKVNSAKDEGHAQQIWDTQETRYVGNSDQVK